MNSGAFSDANAKLHSQWSSTIERQDDHFRSYIELLRAGFTNTFGDIQNPLRLIMENDGEEVCLCGNVILHSICILGASRIIQFQMRSWDGPICHFIDISVYLNGLMNATVRINPKDPFVNFPHFKVIEYIRTLH